MNTINFNNFHYKETSVAYNDKRVQNILALVGKNKSVIDIGCGSGDITKLIKENNNLVIGIEASKACIEKTQEKGIETIHGDFVNDNFELNDKYDVIVGAEVIEHIYDTDLFLQKAKKLLKEDGSLVLTTPNIASLGRRILLLLGINPLIETSLTESAGHIRYFTKKTLEDLLERHNFHIVEYTSDIVNFDSSGRYSSRFLAKVFPSLGRTIIIKAIKE